MRRCCWGTCCGRGTQSVPAPRVPAVTDHAPLFQPSQKGEISLEDAAKAGMPSAAPVVAAGTPAAAAAAVVAQAQAPGAGLPGPPPAPQVATSYLMVVGMVTAEVLADDEEYEEVATPLAPYFPWPGTCRPQRGAADSDIHCISSAKAPSLSGLHANFAILLF